MELIARHKNPPGLVVIHAVRKLNGVARQLPNLLATLSQGYEPVEKIDRYDRDHICREALDRLMNTQRVTYRELVS